MTMNGHRPRKDIRFEGDVSRTPYCIIPISLCLISIRNIDPVSYRRGSDRAQRGIDELEVVDAVQIKVGLKCIQIG